MSDRNEAVIAEFRANSGKVKAFAEQPLLLLTHRGARTGIERTNPVAYFPDDDRYVIVASKGGAPTSPDWYHNLVANPRATIEVGTERFDVIARVAEDDERERLWTMITARNHWFGVYQEKATRTIPVVVLERGTDDPS
jgi:deazaflavin-dependent oxidoreductase (nitroreductase family)